MSWELNVMPWKTADFTLYPWDLYLNYTNKYTTQECVKIPSAYMHFCWSSSLPNSQELLNKYFWMDSYYISIIICITYLFYIYIIPIPKKGNAKECSNYHTIVHISHTSKVMLKIFQARL